MSQLQGLLGPVQSLRARVPERYDAFVRPAGVLVAMALLSMVAMVFGGGSTSAAVDEVPTDTVAVATAEPTAAAAEGTTEPTPSATTDPLEGTTGLLGVDVSPSPEPTVEATVEPTAEATVEPTVAPTPVTLRTVFPTRTPTDEVLTDFVSSEYGVAFSYEVSPDPFVLEQSKTAGGAPVASWLLVRQDELIANGGFTTGLPGMSIEVYEPDPVPADAETWVKTSSDSNLALGDGELRAAVLGGAQGVYYSWSGLHDAVSVAVLWKGRIWVFTGSYRSDFGEIQSSFESLLESVVFYE